LASPDPPPDRRPPVDYLEAILAAGPARRIAKRPIPVNVIFAREDGTCETLEGAVRYDAGDAIVTGGMGERWPVERDLFLDRYVPRGDIGAGEDGTYIKRGGEALAVRLREPVNVPVGRAGDPLHGRPGDWLLSYPDGSYGVIRSAIFVQSYDFELGSA
jgi:hypothetical protein